MLKWLGFPVGHPRLVGAVHLILAVTAVAGVIRIRLDNSPQVFFTRDAAALQSYREARRDFPVGTSIFMFIEGSELWTKASLKWMARIEDTASRLPGVTGCAGPLTLYRWAWPWWPPDDLRALCLRVLASPAARSLGWIDRRGRWMILTIDVEPDAAPAVLTAMEEMAYSVPPSLKVGFSGLPVMRAAMDRALLKQTLPYILVLILLAAGAGVVVMGSLRSALAPLASVAFTLALSLGIMGFFGVSVNLVTVVMIPLLLVITLATAIHVQIHALGHGGGVASGAARIYATYAAKSAPVLWTGLTTMAGFGSLIISASRPIHELGKWTTLGMGISTITMFTLLPALMAWPHRTAGGDKQFFVLQAFSRFGTLCATAATRYPRTVLFSAGLVAMLMIPGIARLSREDHLMRYFPSDHPVQVTMEKMQSLGAGGFQADLILTFSQRGTPSVFNPVRLRRIGELSSRIRRLHGVAGSFGVPELLQSAIEAVSVERESKVPLSLALGLMRAVPAGRELLATFSSPDGSRARIRLALKPDDAEATAAVMNKVLREARRWFPDARSRITGEYPMMVRAQGRLSADLAGSFSMTLVCVVLILFLAAGNLARGLRVIPPNLWPLLVLAGFMGWFDFALNSVSVLTFCVVLGLAADDTLHTLSYLRRLEHAGKEAGIVAVLRRTAPAHLMTSLILVAGFGTCALSPLRPVAQMGVGAAAGILLALLGDLLLVPALIHRESGIKSRRTMEKDPDN